VGVIGENNMDNETEIQKAVVASKIIVAYLGRDANVKATGQEYIAILSAFNFIEKWLSATQSN
jgi:hypothetical protein